MHRLVFIALALTACGAPSSAREAPVRDDVARMYALFERGRGTFYWRLSDRCAPFTVEGDRIAYRFTTDEEAQPGGQCRVHTTRSFGVMLGLGLVGDRRTGVTLLGPRLDSRSEGECVGGHGGVDFTCGERLPFVARGRGEVRAGPHSWFFDRESCERATASPRASDCR